MKISKQTESILTQISNANTKLGDLRKIANEIKKDHELALELWSTERFLARQLAILIMDKKQLSQEIINKLDKDIQQHNESEKLQLMDWLFANQLAKDKKLIALIESWENSSSSLQRRTFWYYQGRLRWMGKPQAYSELLLNKIEQKIEKEQPEVQWAMNFMTGWIGVYEKTYRDRCIAIGEKTGLYKGKMVSKGCTPEYLPDFIAIESKKRNL
ncbi:DNA alkylation repair protein [Flavobacterium sp. xlx-214]|uniref:DNA alkylation repair protein n=1 Tax=unclassified Flavobacterium TaxID=196869 RepID=UPI0013D13A09|nr:MULTISPECIES: DNA alkylation repair protein [unclassified Flavobacterium]MBA5793440.1 DNA alkylation repair protein [Flavobacterium sp. xlx-221]QMI82788.1 DNA alkylation repair protein [Flavobacterium sp. xlx-214]